MVKHEYGISNKFKPQYKELPRWNEFDTAIVGPESAELCKKKKYPIIRNYGVPGFQTNP